jgi:ribonuclease P protein component
MSREKRCFFSDFDLTTQQRASSNTGLFRDRRNGNEADISTFENSARSAPRLPRAQPHQRRSKSSTQPPGAWPAQARAIAAAPAATKRFPLDGSRRLGRKLEFERLLRGGTRRSVGGYVFYYQGRVAGPPRLGILISRKHAADAVDRNRIKRCIREAFRLEQESIASLDVLVRPPYGVRGSPAMMARVRELLRTLR